MSDGPHKSLPMRGGWKKFAERADKAAFEPGEVANAVISALEADWEDDVAPNLGALRKTVGDILPLFGGTNTSAPEGLKRFDPGNSLWRSFVDGFAQAVADGKTAEEALLRGSTFNLPPVQSPVVIPFSEGLDSRAVAGLVAEEYGDRLIRVRLGTKTDDRPKDSTGRKSPFTAVPYRVRRREYRFVESSVRSRGFKFALLSGLDSFWTGGRA